MPGLIAASAVCVRVCAGGGLVLISLPQVKDTDVCGPAVLQMMMS